MATDLPLLFPDFLGGSDGNDTPAGARSEPRGNRVTPAPPTEGVGANASAQAGAVDETMMKTRYPMFVMGLKTLMGLEELLPHQQMLELGLLEPYHSSKMAGRIIFVSHQWTGHTNADATGVQLRTLQR